MRRCRPALDRHDWRRPATPADAAVDLVDPKDEDDAYLASDGRCQVIDVPPLHERSYDVPVIAHALLTSIRDDHDRDDPLPRPHQLAWMQDVGWSGSDDVRTWLELAWRTGVDVTVSPADRPLLPGIANVAVWPAGLPYDEAAVRAQQIRWRLGRFVTQEEAVARLWNLKNLKSWLWTAIPGASAARPGERKRRVMKPLRLPTVALRW